MNTRYSLCLCASLVSLLLSGCFTHNLPKDSFMQGAHSKIVTPWGTHELVIDMAATGLAAKNVTLPEVVPLTKLSTTGKTAK